MTEIANQPVEPQIAAPATALTDRSRPAEKRTRGFNPVASTIKHILLIAASLLMVYPLLWMLVSSFRPTDEIFRDTTLVPNNLTLENYAYGWSALDQPFGGYLINSAHRRPGLHPRQRGRRARWRRTRSPGSSSPARTSCSRSCC